MSATFTETLQNPFLAAAGASLLGLVMGSFLNVLVHRLPRMLEQQWRQQCRELLHPAAASEPAPARYDLALPPSHCPHCGHRLAWRENLPLLSYLRQRGRCRACGQAIGLRYPLLELLAAACGLLAVVAFGTSLTALAAMLLGWGLLALAAIDAEQQLLPDTLTLPLLWLGLLFNSSGLLVSPAAAIIGAVAGYLFLWLIYHGFRLFTGKEGLGRGDFKLLALLGAWLGWQALPAIVVLASLAGASVGLARVVLKRQQLHQAMPFGPFLALAGWLVLLLREPLLGFYGLA